MKDSRNLTFNVVLPMAAVIGLNILIFSLEWNSTPNNENQWLNPPGELIGAVWVVLFLFMGIARYNILKKEGAASSNLPRMIIWYMLFCLSYPFYTLGLSSEIMGFLGNAATFLFAAYLVFKTWPVSRAAALLLFPSLPWIIYATATML